VTFYQWVALEQCLSKGIVRSLDLDSALPAPIPTRAVLVGRFHHRAMELAATLRDLTEFDAQIETEIAKLQATVNGWPQLRRAGSVSGWDEINKSVSLAERIISVRGTNDQVRLAKIESEFRSIDGRLVGKPDYFSVEGRHAVLREYKSSAIRDSTGRPESIYLDQLRFYSVLIFANFDVDHVAARLESLSGDVHELAIGKQEANEFEARVARVIDEVNAALRLRLEFSDLAKPSREACVFCEAKILCDAFKRQQDQLELEGEQFLVEGSVTRVLPASDAEITYITVDDEYRKSTLTLTLPSRAAADVVPRGRWIFLNLRRHGVALAWGHTSRVLSCG
jgi:PD-(D/E)XK nuclease superfamily